MGHQGAHSFRRNRLIALTVAFLLAISIVGTATAAFTSTTSSAGSRFSSLTIPVPQNFNCAGILNLLNPRLVWDPVTVPGATVTYSVTDPNGVSTSTASTQYALKSTLPLLMGTYRLRAQVTAWGWSSNEALRSVTLNGLGLLYICL